MTPHSHSGQPQPLPLGMVSATRVDPLDIRGLLRCLWHGKWIVLLATGGAIILALYYAFAIAQPRYAATATLHIAKTHSLGQDSTATLNPNSEVAVLQSYALLERVADELDLQNDPEFNRALTPVSPWSPRSLRTQVRQWLSGERPAAPDEDAITAKTLDTLQAAVSARAQQDSSVFTVTATTGSEQKSIHIANTLAATYLRDQAETARASAESTVAWLSDKVVVHQVALASKETAISDLVMQAQVTDQATFDNLTHQAQDTDQRLRDARMALAAQISPADTRPINANARRLETQIATLEQLRRNLRDRLSGQSAGLVQLHQLEREADASRVLYETFLGRLQDASLHGGLQQSQSRILSPAGPARYVAPRKTLTVGLAALLGLVVGVCWVFLRDAMQAGFRTPGPLHAATGLPVMAQVPLLRLRKPGQLLDRLSDVASAPTQDAVTNLRTALLVTDAQDPPQIILSTSSTSREGKTLHSVLLAQSLAKLGRSVLLLDGDMRGAGVASYLPTTQAVNLAAVIAEHLPIAHAISRDARWSVDVLKGLAPDVGAPDLFSTAAFSRFMHDLRTRYDHIVVNAPPVLLSPDARMLAQHADAVVYAVRWGKTPLDLVVAGQEALENVHAPITGLVISQVDLRAMRKLGAATGYGTTGSYAQI